MNDVQRTFFVPLSHRVAGLGGVDPFPDPDLTLERKKPGTVPTLEKNPDPT